MCMFIDQISRHKHSIELHKRISAPNSRNQDTHMSKKMNITIKSKYEKMGMNHP